MRLTLPLPPNLANSRTHWRKKHRQRQDYFVRCYTWRSDQHAKRPTKPLQKALIRATLYTWSPMDLDNLMARLKWAVDWLRADGWIVDDSPTHLDWELPKQVVDRKRRRIEIELEAA